MKSKKINGFYNFVTSLKITKAVLKLLGMRSKFRNGEYVQLKCNNSKKFIVTSDALIDGKIGLEYFNADKNDIVKVNIAPSYLEYSIEEMLRRANELNNKN